MQIFPSTSGRSTPMRTGQPFTLCCMPLPVGAAFTFIPQCSPLAATIMGPSIPGAPHNWLAASQSTANALAGELQKRQVSVKTQAAPLRPLNNITGPAIAVEVAPQGSDVNQLLAPDYQQLVTSAVATAIASVRDQLAGAQPQQ